MQLKGVHADSYCAAIDHRRLTLGAVLLDFEARPNCSTNASPASLCDSKIRFQLFQSNGLCIAPFLLYYEHSCQGVDHPSYHDSRYSSVPAAAVILGNILSAACLITPQVLR